MIVSFIITFRETLEAVLLVSIVLGVLIKADKTLQELVVGLYPRCQLCGKTSHCGHHIVSKGCSNALRYELENIIVLCFACHQRWHNTADPETYERIKKVKGGQKWLNKIRKLRAKEVQTTLDFYQKNIKKLIKKGANL